MLKKILKNAACLLFVFSLIITSFAVSAEETGEYEDGHIIVHTVSGINGDSVVVQLEMQNNPGIMAMTISVTYDSSALEYETFYRGYLKDYTVAAHPDKNIIRFVNCESMNKYENRGFVYLQFKIKDDADFGFYPIDIEYKSGDFCNWKLEKFMPAVTSGGVEVLYTGENCSHKNYGEWTVAAEAGCTEPGVKQRVCEKCGHVDLGEIPAIGHDFAPEWTIDEQATENTPGKMSRHCTRCDAVTDVLTFTLEQSEDNGLDNETGTVVKPSDITDDLMEEQLPDVFEDNGGTSVPKEDEGSQNEQLPAGSVIEETPDDGGSAATDSGSGPIGKILDFIGNKKWLKFVLIPLFAVISATVIL